MKANDLFPSKFLKAEDLDSDITLTIKSCGMEEFKDRETGNMTEKLIVYFDEVEKGLLVNKTNFKSIADITAEDDTDNWVGKKVVLTVIDVVAFGETVAAIRVKKPILNRTQLLKKYAELLKKAKELGIDIPSDFDVDEKTPADAIIQAGKQLRELINAAEAI